MFHSLKYDVEFSTGKKLQNDLTLDTGLTAISGRNEAGKSTVLEMLRFSLYGTKALRSDRDTYKSVKVTCSFTVKDTAYRVERSLSRALLYREGEELASGTSIVNDKIKSIFGYGQNVFEVANFCGQGEVERLTSMGGAERKRMVDQTIGFDVIDKLEKFVGGEATEARATVKALQGITAPVPPVMPAGYLPSVAIETKIQDRKPLADEAQHIRGWLSVTRVPPKAPTCNVKELVEELDAQQAEYDRVLDRKRQLEAQLNGVPHPSYGSDDLDLFEEQWSRWKSYNDFVLKHGSKPDYDPAQLSKLEQDWVTLERIAERDRLREQVRKLENNTLTCPLCEGEYPAEHDHLANLSTELETYDELPESLPKPPLSLSQIRLQKDRALAWEGKDVPPSAHKPPLTLDEILNQRKALAVMPLRFELKNIVLPPNRLQDLQSRKLYATQLAAYNEQRVEWDEYQNERKKKLERLAEIGDIDAAINELITAKTAAINYEALSAAYQVAAATYDTNAKKLLEAESELTQYESATKALKLLRSKIKTHLVPSLNVVASQLLARMTGGERNAIEIDEDFERIMVDGQKIETLSGSAKGVSNIAIRLGLGRVLTNRVFSSFMGDELDAAFDEDRAGYTAECLRNLPVQQVIVVSHKTVKADHQIVVGGTT